MWEPWSLRSLLQGQLYLLVHMMVRDTIVSVHGEQFCRCRLSAGQYDQAAVTSSLAEDPYAPRTALIMQIGSSNKEEISPLYPSDVPNDK
jgi:hypothetical protein